MILLPECTSTHDCRVCGGLLQEIQSPLIWIMQRLCFYVTVLAASLSHGLPEKRATSPSVSIWNGTIIGSSLGGIDSFKGIPFAQPPTKSLRLKPPQPITKAYGTITATGTPTACPQQSFQVDSSNLPSNVIGMIEDSPFFQKATVSGEDCLTLNIQRPSTAKQGSKLPVLFWIYGGGFEFGSTQMYDGSNIVRKSVTMGKDIIYVSTNYRVGGFGFLAGKELQKDGSTNLGLRDQRLAMQWVAENIATFGGDPSKVTLWVSTTLITAKIYSSIILLPTNATMGNAYTKTSPEN